jgi:glycosyltransferase involved in cell wall biosynthesis
MRLLLVHNRYRSVEPSGENHVVETEAGELTRRGHDVRVWGPSSDEIAGYGRMEKALLPGRVIWSGSSARAFAHSLDDHRPDVVHLHNTFPLISASILRVLRGRDVPAVATIHNYRLICPGGTLFRDGRICHDCLTSTQLLGIRHGCYRESALATAPIAIANVTQTRAWRRLGALLTLSAAQRELFIAAGFDGDRVIVKPNFVPELAGSADAGPPGAGFVYAGRLADTKGVRVIIEAWDRLAARGLHPGLTIVGGGPLEAEVGRFAARHPQVKFLGRVTRPECLEAFRGCRAVLVPSIWEETFGLVVVEAMMLGRPAVATQLGSFPDLIDHDRDGLLVPPGDAEALAGAVAALDADAGLAARLGTIARQTYEERFRPGPNLELLESIYARVQAKVAAA